MNYIGHAGTQYWAAERLLQVSDLGLLTNTGRFPLLVPMTCLDGYFIWPKPPGNDYASLGESMVRLPNGGAIASWSPSGYGVVHGHDWLNRLLYRKLLIDGVRQVGAATTQAKLEMYAATGSYRDLVETYTLFGDPALQIQAPYWQYFPLVSR